MPDIMQDPAEIATERTLLQRENRALRTKLTNTRTALEAADEALREVQEQGVPYPDAVSQNRRNIAYTLSVTQP